MNGGSERIEAKRMEEAKRSKEAKRMEEAKRIEKEPLKTLLFVFAHTNQEEEYARVYGFPAIGKGCGSSTDLRQYKYSGFLSWKS